MIGSLGESEFRSRQNEGNAHDEQENSQNHRQAEIGDDAWRVDFRIVEHAARVAAEEVSPISDVRGSESYRRALVGAFVRNLLHG